METLDNINTSAVYNNLDMTAAAAATVSTMSTATNSTNNSETEIAASTRVLQTYELVEDIIMRLPLRDLLLVQRVNKNFKSVVDRSQNIGQALFLKPCSSGGLFWAQDYEWRREKSDEAVQPVFNPFFINPSQRCVRSDYMSTGIRSLDESTQYQLDIGRSVLSVSNGLILPAGSGKRQMLMTQPPITKLDVFEYHEWARGFVIGTDRPTGEYGVDVTGIKFGTLVDAASSMMLRRDQTDWNIHGLSSCQYTMEGAETITGWEMLGMLKAGTGGSLVEGKEWERTWSERRTAEQRASLASQRDITEDNASAEPVIAEMD